MASALKKVNKITQIVRLKQMIQKWKLLSLTRPRVIPGHVGVYVGLERRRFVIPARYLNLPVFLSLLHMYAEEFGLHCAGGLVFPIEVNLFQGLLKLLEKNEERYGGVALDELLNMFSQFGVENCKEMGNGCHVFTPLLERTRV